MNILFVARRYWPAVGGVESFLRQLAHKLAERHAVTVLAHRTDDGPSSRLTDSLDPPPSFAAFADGPVCVEPLVISSTQRALLAPLVSHVVPGLRRYAYGRARVGAAYLYGEVVAPTIARAAREADVVHFFGSDLLAWAAVRGARHVSVPSVVTPFAHAGQWGDDPASALVYRSADQVVALLESDAALYRALGVPAERVSVCGVGSPGVPAGGGRKLRERLRIAGPLVLFLGVRRPYKGFDVLVEAARYVRRARPDATFAFVGPGPRLPVDKADVPHVLDIGPVAESNRAAWLDAADLLCLPSEGEIFPMSILEAWSVGTPVVGSAIASLAELIGNAGGGVTALREPRAFAAAIVDLLASPARLAALGAAGCAFWAEHHTVAAIAERHERLYAALLERSVTSCVA